MTPYNLFFLIITNLVKYKIRVISIYFQKNKNLKILIGNKKSNNVNFKGIGCICDPGFDGEFCEITTTVAPATTESFSESNTDD